MGFLVCFLILIITSTGAQKLHNYASHRSSSQNILVIGETGSGKSTFVQYMLVDDISKVDHTKIGASINSVTNSTLQHRAPTFVIGDEHVSATYYDTIGFNADDIDSTAVFEQLKELVRFSDTIHKIIIVHRLGRARKEMVRETTRTIQLLQALGAQQRNVYVTLTFAYDYHRGILIRLKREVAGLYNETVHSDNIFYSHYVLLNEIDEKARSRYQQRMVDTHDAILRRVLEDVPPFRPVIATFKQYWSHSNSWSAWFTNVFAHIGLGVVGLVVLITSGYFGIEQLKHNRRQERCCSCSCTVAVIPLLICAFLAYSGTYAAAQKLHDYPSHRSAAQNILVIGETGSGKSTFVQYMLVDDISKVDHTKIGASINSVTNSTLQHRAPTFIIDDTHVSATYYDTIGFNADDIDSTVVFKQLEDFVKFSDTIHKILVVHRLGRARREVLTETTRTIQLLKALGANTHNVYVTLTFAYDYHRRVLDRLKKEVAGLYSGAVNAGNIFYSHYVLLSEIEEDARPYYKQRMIDTHKGILQRMLEDVRPFRPVVATF